MLTAEDHRKYDSLPIPEEMTDEDRAWLGWYLAMEQWDLDAAEWSAEDAKEEDP